MAAVAGYTGKVQFGVNTIVTVTDWDLPINSEMYDTTTIQNLRPKTYVPGLYDTQLNFKFNWDVADTLGWQVLQTQILATSPTITAFTVSTSNGAANSNYAGSGWVKTFKVHDPVAGKVEIDVTLQVSGAITVS